MKKKFVLATLVAFVATIIEGFLVHGYILYSDYAQLPGLYRTEADSQNYSNILIAAHLVLAVAMVWIYRQGKRSNKHYIGQGIRFGLSIALVSTVPIYMVLYAVQPLPALLVAKQIVYDTIGMVLIGILVARVEN